MAAISPEQEAVFKVSFNLFDKDKDGIINKDDLRSVLKSLGQDPSEGELIAMINSVDTDHSGTIDFKEFKEMMAKKIPEESKKSNDGPGTINEKCEKKLKENLLYRYKYICEFMGITESDINMIHACNKVLAPKLDDIVADCFKKLWLYSCTKQVFFKGQDLTTLKSGSLDSTGADKWKAVSDQLVVQRRLTLKKFMERLLGEPYDQKMMEEMNRLGAIHSTLNGRIEAPLLHVNVMLGFLQDEILKALFNHRANECDNFNAAAAARAFCKIFTVVGEFISKNYLPLEHQ